MAFTVTSVAHAKELLEKTNERMKKAKDNAEARAGMFLHTGETLLATATFAAANNALGKDGVLSVGGIPIDGAVGTALHVMATYGVFGKHDEHMHWLATGALASFVYRQSAALGAKMATKLPGGQPQQAAAGALPYPYPAPMMGAGPEAAPPYMPPYAAPAAAPAYPGFAGVPGAPPGPPRAGG